MHFLSNKQENGTFVAYKTSKIINCYRLQEETAISNPLWQFITSLVQMPKPDKPSPYNRPTRSSFSITNAPVDKFEQVPM